MRHVAGLLTLALAVAGCTPRIVLPGPARAAPVLAGETFQTADGQRLAVRAWLPDRPARAVVVAVHGFNDYSAFFEAPGAWFAAHGTAAYAYDQRGFGQGPHPGLWAGARAMAGDLAAVTAAVRARHPGVPLFVLGESMGGAVAMVAATGENPPPVDGYILSAPAVWGRATMPFYQRAALWMGAHVAPAMRLSGRGLDIWPSDNVEMLRALGRDPLVIKETRIDAVWGLTDLMDAALAAGRDLDARALVLYGERDEVIPPAAFRALTETFRRAPSAGRTVALYRDGWHMLLRDLQAQTVWADIAAWMADPARPLPSGADARARACLSAEKTDAGPDCFPKRVGTPLER